MKPKATLVTGASKGIGRAVADRLAAGGHHVVGIARAAPADGFKGTFFTGDLAEEASAKAVLAQVTERFDIVRLVNNAGLSRADGPGDMPRATYDQQMDINVRATILCIEACVPAMREARFGRILNIGSRSALGRGTRIAYSAAKAGVIGLTRAYAIALAKDAITVNCLAPGTVETELLSRGYPPGSETRAKAAAAIPIGRFGQVGEIAAAAAYFLSDEAGYTSGQTLYVDGGLSIGAQLT